MTGKHVLRERIAQALLDEVDLTLSSRLVCADAVIAALGLVEKPGVRLGCADGTAVLVNGVYMSNVFGGCPEFQATGNCPHCAAGRHWETPWERIEDDMRIRADGH